MFSFSWVFARLKARVMISAPPCSTAALIRLMLYLPEPKIKRLLNSFPQEPVYLPCCFLSFLHMHIFMYFSVYFLLYLLCADFFFMTARSAAIPYLPGVRHRLPLWSHKTDPVSYISFLVSTHIKASHHLSGLYIVCITENQPFHFRILRWFSGHYPKNLSYQHGLLIRFVKCFTDNRIRHE